MATSAYTNRYIALLEILDFRDMVAGSVVKPEILKHLHAMLSQDHANKYVEFICNEVGYSEKAPFPGFQATSFGPYMVVSTDAIVSQPMLLMYLFHLVNELAMFGFFLRGALTRGLLYHSDNTVFGPAMVRVYQRLLEKGGYPRVIVDENIEDDLNNPVIHMVAYEGEESSPICASLVLDKDSTCFVNTVEYARTRAQWEHNYERHCEETNQENVQNRPTFWRDWPELVVGQLKARFDMNKERGMNYESYGWYAMCFLAKYEFTGGARFLSDESRSHLYTMADEFSHAQESDSTD